MRDKKRREKEMLEEAYKEVHNEMNLGPAAQTASGALGSLGPVVVDVEQEEFHKWFQHQETQKHPKFQHYKTDPIFVLTYPSNDVLLQYDKPTHAAPSQFL